VRAQPQRAHRLHACIDVCSARAIRSDARLRKGKGKNRGPVPGAARRAKGGGIVVEPHLCVGCGACTTVCPSGAMSFAYPGTVDQGRKRLRTLLTPTAVPAAATRAAAAQPGRRQRTDRRPGPRGSDWTARCTACRRACCRWRCGTPPAPGWTCGWLPSPRAPARCWVLLTDEEAPEYREALAAQMAVGQAMLTGLGYAGEHLG
jgi:ferredoxin